MGGNALKLVGIESRRIRKNEFADMVDAVTTAAGDLLNWIKPVKFYHAKPDMGDIDFVAFGKSEEQGEQIVAWGEALMRRLGSKGYHYNRPVLSFEFQGVQIDIATKYSDVAANAYLNFCHYSPIGNVVGKMLKQTGAKWGVDGLVYPVRDGNDGTSHMLGYIPLSMGIDAPMKLAGLDTETWKTGFENENAISAFCVESRLFNKEIFAFENLNHATRKRERLRPDYHFWLEYIKDKPDKYRRHASREEEIEGKKAWRVDLCKMFPDANLEAERQTLLDAAEEKRNLNKKFNGLLVRELTGLEGKALGDFLTNFKGAFVDLAAYEAWVRQASKEEIKAKVLEAGSQPEISI